MYYNYYLLATCTVRPGDPQPVSGEGAPAERRRPGLCDQGPVQCDRARRPPLVDGQDPDHDL